VLRYSKERLPSEIPAIACRGEGRDQVDLLRADTDANILIVGYGQFAGIGLGVAEKLAAAGVPCTVADPTWCVPHSPELIRLAQEHEMVVSIEDNLVSGGLGEKLLGRLAGAGPQVLIFGVRYGFLAQGTREEVLEDLGLTARDIARNVLEAMLQRQVEITQSV